MRTERLYRVPSLYGRQSPEETQAGFLKIGAAARASSCAVGFFFGGFLTSRLPLSLFPMRDSLPQFAFVG